MGVCQARSLCTCFCAGNFCLMSKKWANTLLALAYTEIFKWRYRHSPQNLLQMVYFLKYNIKQAPTLVFSVKCPPLDFYRCHINKLSRIFLSMSRIRSGIIEFFLLLEEEGFPRYYEQLFNFLILQLTSNYPV